MNHEEVKELTEHFDTLYVQQRECQKRQEEVNRMFANDDKRLDIIAKDIEIIKDGINNWKKIGTGVMTALLTQP